MPVNECYEYLKTLSPEFSKKIPKHIKVTDAAAIRGMLRQRNIFSHKGDYGYGAIIAGSEGMMGAVALCAKAFMRSGGGKLTCHIPAVGRDVLQISVPEAMVKIEAGKDHIESVSSLEKYDAVGVGPGLGSYKSHEKLIEDIFESYEDPVVVDADALNTIAGNKLLLKKIPANSVITPHAKEFERIFGETENDFDRMNEALKGAARHNITIVLKGAYTFIATPLGEGNFNTTGNPGMATAGTGDVLTGIITGLIAQQYSPEHAAIIGVYIHGLAGDIAAEELSKEALIASDVIAYLGKAFKTLQ